MKIPPPPTVACPPPPLFAGARDKQKQDKLGDDIRDMLDRLLRVTHTPAWQEMFHKFKAVVNPGGACNVTRLPYQTSGPNLAGGAIWACSKHAPLACLYARLSWIIQSYWKLRVHGTEKEEHIRMYMREIDVIAANDTHLQRTLRDFEVDGDTRTGFWLAIPGVG